MAPADLQCRAAREARHTLLQLLATALDTLPFVKFLYRVLTALNFEPSMATLAFVDKQSAAKRDVLREHFLDSGAVVAAKVGLVVGESRCNSQITSRLGLASRSSPRLD